MPVAYSYVRFSREKQLQGDSLRRQVELSQSYARERGFALDTTLKLQDLGVSAFTQANVKTGALGGFLAAVSAGVVKPGSYLLIESWDRLSRAAALVAFDVFREIIAAGITIVTLEDRQEYSKESVERNSMQLFLTLAGMVRAHEESRMKSHRLAAAWQQKRATAATKKLTRKCPSWLEVSADRTSFKKRPDAVRIVKAIIKWSRMGHGQTQIARRLNSENTPNISGSPTGWGSSYIAKILTSRALYGEARFEVHKNGTRTQVGDPLPNYYPALLSQSKWEELQTIRTRRHTGGGGPVRREQVTNLFSGLLRCGYCGEPMVIGGYSKKDPIKTKKFIVCAGAKRGKPCYFIQWMLAGFESTVLTFLCELDIQSVLPEETGSSPSQALRDKHIELVARKDELRSRISNLSEAIELGRSEFSLKTVMEKLAERETELLEIDNQLKKLERELAAVDSIDELLEEHHRQLVRLAAAMPPSSGERRGEVRLSLSENIRGLVSKIQVFAGGPESNVEQGSGGGIVFKEGKALRRDSRMIVIQFRDGRPNREIHTGKNGTAISAVD